MYKVQITNYESISHAELEINGFTTLVGRNYLGKSSILRAIDAALNNQSGTSFIKWGESFCEVKIQGPGLDLTWHKEEGNNFYEINGQITKKIGRDEPPKAIEEAGFKILKFGSKKVNLNYSEQFKQLFLVDSEEIKNVDLLTSMYGLDRIYKAIDLCNREQRDNVDLLKLRQKDYEQNEDDLQKYKRFEDVKDEISKIKSLKNTVSKMKNEIALLSSYSNDLRSLVSACRTLQPVLSTEIPSSKDISCKIESFKSMANYNSKLTQLKESIIRVKPVEKIELPKSKNIIVYLEELRDICKLTTEYEELQEEMSRLKTIEDVILPEIIYDIPEIKELHTWFNKIETQKKELLSCKDDITKVNNELLEIKGKINSYEICPACGSKIGGNHEYN